MAVNPALPAHLKAAVDTLLEGVSRKELAPRAAAISGAYRGGGGSAGAVTARDDALAYLVARLPATYAVAAAVFDQITSAAVGFAPVSLLDAGAGPGTAAVAAREVWRSLRDVTLLEPNAQFRALAEQFVPNATMIARGITGAALPQAELVIANFVLAEIAEQRATVEALWSATLDTLVLVEPGTPAGFERICAARTQLIASGAYVIGPCTHAQACPIVAPDWCHFSQRLPRSRDHLIAKDARVPFEDERYSWIAVSRQRRSAFDGQARVLTPPKEAKPGTTFRVCTAAGIEDRFIARRDRVTFARLRRAGWGDVIG
ncbi:MAG: SAM-dependent methyltransferase [Proteobacteria bacterium]|nr:SAM-dependent methyltransferase [Pseudomonadota bacterium]